MVSKGEIKRLLGPGANRESISGKREESTVPNAADSKVR